MLQKGIALPDVRMTEHWNELLRELVGILKSAWTWSGAAGSRRSCWSREVVQTDFNELMDD